MTYGRSRDLPFFVCGNLVATRSAILRQNSDSSSLSFVGGMYVTHSCYNRSVTHQFLSSQHQHRHPLIEYRTCVASHERHNPSFATPRRLKATRINHAGTAAYTGG